jgi:hypothetical protein
MKTDAARSKTSEHENRCAGWNKAKPEKSGPKKNKRPAPTSGGRRKSSKEETKKPA